MRSLVISLYLILYKLSNQYFIALLIALLYVAVLNMVMLYGMSMLLAGWLPVGSIHRFFLFPYSIASTIAMFLFVVWMGAPYKPYKKYEKNIIHYVPVVIYTLMSVLLVVYIKCMSK